jgi:hypothetical protein
MSIVNNNSNSILSPENISLESGSSDSGFFGWIQNISFITWIIIVFILAFLGFNVFTYLAKGTQEVTSIFQPIVGLFANIVATITGKTLEYAGEGGKDVVDTAATVLDDGLDQVTKIGETIQPNGTTSSLSGGQLSNTQQAPDNIANSALNKAINTAQTRQAQSQNQSQQKESHDYLADEANSSIQGGGKSGWCYIGEDRGFRSCALVGESDTCVSGDIFPTKQLCVNPNLRT